jgi:hypothetical protein
MLLAGYTVKAAEEIVQAEQSSHHDEKNISVQLTGTA